MIARDIGCPRCSAGVDQYCAERVVTKGKWTWRETYDHIERQKAFLEFLGASEHLHVDTDQRVFVFGSNVLGIHGGGAAWYARNQLGAEMGIGEGLTGRTYALPTCYRPGEPVTDDELIVYVNNFLTVAEAELDTVFFVSPVGCGIAGFDERFVSSLFINAPTNCDLPPGWRLE